MGYATCQDWLISALVVTVLAVSSEAQDGAGDCAVCCKENVTCLHLFCLIPDAAKHGLLSAVLQDGRILGARGSCKERLGLKRCGSYLVLEGKGKRVYVGGEGCYMCIHWYNEETTMA